VAEDTLDELKKSLEGMNDAEVQREAASRNLNTDGARDKAEIIALIVADEDEKHAAARFAKMQEEEAAMAAKTAEPSAIAATIARFDSEFCAAPA
jgi:hypothetical protein